MFWIIGSILFIIALIIFIIKYLTIVQVYECNLIIYLFPAEKEIKIYDFSNWEDSKLIILQVGVTKDYDPLDVYTYGPMITEYPVTKVYKRKNLVIWEEERKHDKKNR